MGDGLILGAAVFALTVVVQAVGVLILDLSAGLGFALINSMFRPKKDGDGG